MMTYEESYSDAVESKAVQSTLITQVRALQEVKKHNVDAIEFFEDCGVKAEYAVSEVLEWLGY